MFWGLFFVALGAILLMNYAFGFNLPVFRVLFSLGIIYFGVSMLFGTFDLKLTKVATTNEAVFSSSKFSLDLSGSAEDNSTHKYSTAFGEGELDLTDVDLTGGPVNLAVNTAFGETRIYVKKGTPVRLRTNTFFGEVEFPNGKMSTFGKDTYEVGAKDGQPAVLNIDAKVAFGELEVIER